MSDKTSAIRRSLQMRRRRVRLPQRHNLARKLKLAAEDPRVNHGRQNLTQLKSAPEKFVIGPVAHPRAPIEKGPVLPAPIVSNLCNWAPAKVCRTIERRDLARPGRGCSSSARLPRRLPRPSPLRHPSEPQPATPLPKAIKQSILQSASSFASPQPRPPSLNPNVPRSLSPQKKTATSGRPFLCLP